MQLYGLLSLLNHLSLLGERASQESLVLLRDFLGMPKMLGRFSGLCLHQATLGVYSSRASEGQSRSLPAIQGQVQLNVSWACDRTEFARLQTKVILRCCWLSPVALSQTLTNSSCLSHRGAAIGQKIEHQRAGLTSCSMARGQLPSILPKSRVGFRAAG